LGSRSNEEEGEEGMTDKPKLYCPLLSLSMPSHLSDCLKEACAWYMPNKEDCVIRIIARDLSSIAYTIYTKAEI